MCYGKKIAHGSDLCHINFFFEQTCKVNNINWPASYWLQAQPCSYSMPSILTAPCKALGGSPFPRSKTGLCWLKLPRMIRPWILGVPAYHYQSRGLGYCYIDRGFYMNTIRTIRMNSTITCMGNSVGQRKLITHGPRLILHIYIYYITYIY